LFQALEWVGQLFLQEKVFKHVNLAIDLVFVFGQKSIADKLNHDVHK
jgi:hypothetical protein